MFIRLLAAFIIIPLIELALLMKLAELTSIFTTIALVIVTGVIGSYLARQQGIMVLHRFQSALAEGRMPSRELQDGLMIVFAAALLLTPGLLTDTVGFVLLFPIGRELIRQTLLRRYIGRFNVQVTTSGFEAEPLNRPAARNKHTIDVQAVKRKSAQ